MSRFLVRYRFTRPAPQITGTSPDGIVTGIYRDAESVEQAFEDERRLWELWGADIEFVEGRKIR